jgi:hypothetical protein
MRLLRTALFVALVLVVSLALEWSLLDRVGQLLDEAEADRAAWTARGLRQAFMEQLVDGHPGTAAREETRGPIAPGSPCGRSGTDSMASQ